MEHGGHRENLGAEITEDAQQDRKSRQQPRRLASVADGNGVWERDRIAELGEEPESLGQEKEGEAKADDRGDDHPRRAEPHPVDQPGPADEPETAHRAREDGESRHEDAQVASCHEEVACRIRPPEGPHADADAHPQIGDDADQHHDGTLVVHQVPPRSSRRFAARSV